MVDQSTCTLCSMSTCSQKLFRSNMHTLRKNGAFIHLLCSVLKLATKGCFMSMEYGFSCSRHNCHLPVASPHDVTILQPGKCHFEHLVFLHTRRWQQTLCPCRRVASGLSLRALGFPAHSVCEESRAFRATLLHAIPFAEYTNDICSDTCPTKSR